MIKTAIIGASGYIGKHLLSKYREYFPDCIGTGFSQVKQDLISFDLCNPNAALLHLRETEHEAVIIASAMPNIAKCEANAKDSYALNVTGTLKLVKQLEELSLKTFFLSSDYVFNGETGHYQDDAETNPITEYGRQKAEVEKEIPNLTNNYNILRLSKIYGTIAKDNTLLDSLAADFVQGRKITVALDQFFSPTHIDDVVSMLLFIQNQNKNGLINLCNNNAYSRYQIAYKLAEELHIPTSHLQALSLHSIPGMETRPLNTSLLCSSSLLPLQNSLISIDDAVKRVGANWNHANTRVYSKA